METSQVGSPKVGRSKADRPEVASSITYANQGLKNHVAAGLKKDASNI